MRIAPPGFWISALAPESLARATLRLAFPSLTGDRAVWYSELCPEERGRTTIARMGPQGDRTEVLPAPWSALSRVHEYGGCSLLVSGSSVSFVEQADQQIWVLGHDGRPRRLTEENGTRFAELVDDSPRGRILGTCQ